MPPTADDRAAPDPRAGRRDRRRAGVALAIVLPVLLAGGCGPESALLPAAEVADAGPDCLADEVLWGLGLTPPDGHDRPAPASGSVPADFDAVAVVDCRGGWRAPIDLQPEVTTPPERLDRVSPKDVVTAGPGLVDDLAQHEVDLQDLPAVPEPVPAPVSVTVVEAELRGDLGPLLAALARPSQQPAPGEACPAMMQMRPVIYLLDAEGRAILARWPTTGCGFLLDDGAPGLLDALEVVRETTRTAGAA